MRRALAALAVIAAAVAGAVWLADRPGSVAVTWQGWRLDTSVAVVALGAAFLVFAAAWLLAMLGRLGRAPGNFLRARRERRRRDGYRALTYGLSAAASGDTEEAERNAKRAQKLLDEPLTLLLSAQTAQLKGDEDGARRAFTAMLEKPETEFLGLRGLIALAMRRGEEGVAAGLLERAHGLRPKAPFVLRARYELAARAGRWDDADAALAEAARRKAIPAEEGRHHRAAILLEQGRAAKAQGRAGDALKLARAAFETAPGLAPATRWYADLLAAEGAKRRARKALEKGWRTASHPELAASYGALYADETPLARVKRFERLLSLNPEAIEGRIALANAALQARLWGEARRHLTAAGVAGGGASPRLCQLMAELEEAEHGDSGSARRWRERAAASEAPDPAYQCNACGYETRRWSALCPRCRGFDQLVWRKHPGRGEGFVPPEGASGLPAAAGSAIIPLS